jgi:malate synthase
LAAFEMEEILYELRQHIVGLNAGRWDYIFSVIKKFYNNPEFILPDRVDVTMRVPFMRAYTQLLVQTCHRRGAHAIGGMAAFIPNRRDEAVNKMAFEKVTADKELEASTGFDGTWVAHPDLVPIASAPFDKYLGEKPHQKEVLLENIQIKAANLLDTRIDNGQITESGLRMNINVGILYIASWLRGVGAAAIHNLMEDAATAEISRAQVWQWLHQKVRTNAGQIINQTYYEKIFTEEVLKIKNQMDEAQFNEGKYAEAVQIFDDLVRQPAFEEFLTIKSYQNLGS